MVPWWGVVRRVSLMVLRAVPRWGVLWVMSCQVAGPGWSRMGWRVVNQPMVRVRSRWGVSSWRPWLSRLMRVSLVLLRWLRVRVRAVRRTSLMPAW
ncbi:predicted protein [Streptomyces iranensis]|uniref:Uncharacterized protein n=1 Tax=Streptomyces iranensis TaxID=576784 RepID=A0A060ZGF2_9ACTN|nr:predicted protein [Streptomyces iranensis]